MSEQAKRAALGGFGKRHGDHYRLTAQGMAVLIAASVGFVIHATMFGSDAIPTTRDPWADCVKLADHHQVSHRLCDGFHTFSPPRQ